MVLSLPSWLLLEPTHPPLSPIPVFTRASRTLKYRSIPASPPGATVPPFSPLDLARLFRGLPAALKAPPVHFLPIGHRGSSRAQTCTWTLRSPPPPVSSALALGEETQASSRPVLALGEGCRGGLPGAGASALCCPVQPRGLRSSDGPFHHPRPTWSIPAALVWTAPAPEKADSGQGRGPGGTGGRGAGGWARPTGAIRPRPLAPPLAATERVDPRLRALRGSSPPGSRLGSDGRRGAALRGCPAGRGWAGRGRDPALSGPLTLAPSPSQPRRARTHTPCRRAAPGRDGRGAALQPAGGQLQPGAGRRAALGRLGAAPGPRG